jgi:hypothetical protein
VSEGCVVYDGYIAPNGYGKRHHTYAHREAWEVERGPIPEGMTIDHLCGTRSCINVEHLEVVTRGENTRRGNARREYERGRYCPAGHDKDEVGRVNLYHCKACAYARTAAYNRERRRKAREGSSS